MHFGPAQHGQILILFRLLFKRNLHILTEPNCCFTERHCREPCVKHPPSEGSQPLWSAFRSEALQGCPIYAHIPGWCTSCPARLYDYCKGVYAVQYGTFMKLLKELSLLSSPTHTSPACLTLISICNMLRATHASLVIDRITGGKRQLNKWLDLGMQQASCVCTKRPRAEVAALAQSFQDYDHQLAQRVLSHTAAGGSTPMLHGDVGKASM